MLFKTEKLSPEISIPKPGGQETFNTRFRSLVIDGMNKAAAVIFVRTIAWVDEAGHVIHPREERRIVLTAETSQKLFDRLQEKGALPMENVEDVIEAAFAEQEKTRLAPANRIADASREGFASHAENLKKSVLKKA